MDNFQNYTLKINSSKPLYTPGPGPILAENLLGIGPCFGRNDEHYQLIEEDVLNWLKIISGKENMARFQGSGSLANEIGITNFVYGKVFILNTGHYSDRLNNFVLNLQKQGLIQKVCYEPLSVLEDCEETFDWLIAVPSETSTGLLTNINQLKILANNIGARLFLDAVASIGLENGHELADVVCFSSCKGLFGLTGGSFIGYNETPLNEVNSFYLNLKTHSEKLITGPYHTIMSLHEIIPIHDSLKYSVEVNKQQFLKKFADYLVHPKKNQPLLSTATSKKIRISEGHEGILYIPRSEVTGSVVCHLGEAHLGREAEGKLINNLEIAES